MSDKSGPTSVHVLIIGNTCVHDGSEMKAPCKRDADASPQLRIAKMCKGAEPVRSSASPCDVSLTKWRAFQVRQLQVVICIHREYG